MGKKNLIIAGSLLVLLFLILVLVSWYAPITTAAGITLTENGNKINADVSSVKEGDYSDITIESGHKTIKRIEIFEARLEAPLAAQAESG